MKRIALLVLAAASAACTGLPDSPPLDTVMPDSARTVWGDEFEDHYIEPEPVVPARGIRAEWVDGDTRSARLDAFAMSTRVLARSARGDKMGSVSWHGDGVVREVSAGDVTPRVAEGALIGDPRTSSDLRAPSSVQSEGLRLSPSASVSSAMRGAGIVLAPGKLRVGLGGIRAASRRAILASVERDAGSTTIGAAAGTTIGRTGIDKAGSLYLAHQGDASFTCAEVALASGGGVRTVARAVVGERREWSAIAIAGMGPARDEPLVFARRERWGAALERRDGWGWGGCRSGVSSLTRRDVDADVRRRRAFWDGVWRVSHDVQLELAARVTRETSTGAEGGVLSAMPEPETHDDWRARITLRSGHTDDAGLLIENAYRLEWVQNRTGRPGTVATWTGRVRNQRVDGRVSATAHALYQGQVAYEPDTAPLAAGEYTAIGGKGAALAASLRVALGAHVWLGAAWSRRPPAGSRVWITAGIKA